MPPARACAYGSPRRQRPGIVVIDDKFAAAPYPGGRVARSIREFQNLLGPDGTSALPVSIHGVVTFYDNPEYMLFRAGFDRRQFREDLESTPPSGAGARPKRAG